MTIKTAVKLIKDVTIKINSNEHNTVTMSGVKGLTRDDLESAVFYAETYVESGGNGFTGLMEPMGRMKELLDKYDLK